MLRGTLLALAMLPAAAAGAPLWAQVPAGVPADPAQQGGLELRAGQLVALMNGELEAESLFTDAFLAAVPAAQIRAIADSMTAQHGRAIAAEILAPQQGTRATLLIRFERGLAKGGIAINPGAQDRISELLFTSVDAVAIADDTVERIAADLAALPGTVAALFTPLDGGPPVISMAPDKPLALGSAFKLYVLAALAEDIAEGKRAWSDVVPLSVTSYPSGKLQDWPQGAPLTLHTLASLMISISDNTATDQLIEVLGRDRVLQMVRDTGHADPALNDPFLTTREFFVLKGGDPERLAAFAAGDAATRRAMLEGLQGSAVTPDQVTAAFAGGPRALSVEWLASPADLARLLSRITSVGDETTLGVLAINPAAAPAVRSRWAYVGYKGGSEPGVLNLTWLLRDQGGRWHMLTLGWNNPAASVDTGTLQAIAQRILLLPG